MSSDPKPEAPKEKKLADKQTAAQKYKALLEEANKHKETAANELKAQIQDAIVELNELGFNYRLVEGSAGAATKKPAKRERDPNKPCGICNFITNPPHDARLKAHRDQGENKKPLSASQLKEAGLEKVS